MPERDALVARLIEAPQLQALIDGLKDRGYAVFGPRRRDAAIVLDEITRIEELPRGYATTQSAGHYRLEATPGAALFGFTPGADSVKRWLHPPRQTEFRFRREGASFVPVESAPVAVPRSAFLGIRACELAAIEVTDRVFLGGPQPDRGYQGRRENAFLVAVNCAAPGGSCFCTSTGTGPRAEHGFDLALTELAEPEHRFLVEIGSERGAELAAHLPGRPAPADAIAAAAAVSARCAAAMLPRFDPARVARRLREAPEHPRWASIAARCLACANCTTVCPTCFCTTTVDRTDLAGSTATHERDWDSCFTLGFTHLPGGSVRTSVASRYRQWMTHKLSSWLDQFGTLGCVGCGRCATWCPAGIDLAAEAAAVDAEPDARAGSETHAP
jgi:formate hydrogenlyase subunit 6/NADH:ubiquinone oxidoreductase subunit I